MTAEEKTQLEKLVEKYLKEDAYKPRGWGERAARYGCNGMLLKGESGQLYAVTGRTSAIYIF